MVDAPEGTRVSVVTRTGDGPAHLWFGKKSSDGKVRYYDRAHYGDQALTEAPPNTRAAMMHGSGKGRGPKLDLSRHLSKDVGATEHVAPAAKSAGPSKPEERAAEPRFVARGFDDPAVSGTRDRVDAAAKELKKRGARAAGRLTDSAAANARAYIVKQLVDWFGGMTPGERRPVFNALQEKAPKMRPVLLEVGRKLAKQRHRGPLATAAVAMAGVAVWCCCGPCGVERPR